MSGDFLGTRRRGVGRFGRHRCGRRNQRCFGMRVNLRRGRDTDRRGDRLGLGLINLGSPGLLRRARRILPARQLLGVWRHVAGAGLHIELVAAHQFYGQRVEAAVRLQILR